MVAWLIFALLLVSLYELFMIHRAIGNVETILWTIEQRLMERFPTDAEIKSEMRQKYGP